MRTLRRQPDGRLDDAALLDDPALGQVLDMLNRDGEEARVVGGAVRNGLLGLPAGDIDIATTALPEVVMARATAARLRPIPTGVDHGTVTVMVGRAGFEVTTLREDVATDGRHAVVRFGRDFATDAQRRDFTINALSVSRDGTIHDTTGGTDDLAAGRVRFIGDAERRIREDYLRVLRFFRFSAAYGEGPVDAEGLAASARHKDGLSRLSRERLRAEMLKLLAAPRAAEVVAEMDRLGIAPLVLAGACRPVRLERLVAFEQARGAPPDVLLRLAALVGMDAVTGAAAALRLRDQLRLSNEEYRRLADAAEASRGLRPDARPGPDDLRALLYRWGRRAACDAVSLAAADTADAEAWQAALAFLTVTPEPQLPLSGADVMARGIASGRQVGAVLEQLRTAWIAAGFPQDPAALAALLEAAIAAQQSRG